MLVVHGQRCMLAYETTTGMSQNVWCVCVFFITARHWKVISQETSGSQDLRRLLECCLKQVPSGSDSVEVIPVPA